MQTFSLPSDSENHSQSSEPDNFLELVEAVELHAGAVLEGHARARCLRAFREWPKGFKIVAENAVTKGGRNPVGLLVWTVDRGHPKKLEEALMRREKKREGELSRLTPRLPSAVGEKTEGSCNVCGSVGEMHVFAGQLWCSSDLADYRRIEF